MCPRSLFRLPLGVQARYGATAAVFGTASHRLSPQAPYQADPGAWVDAFEGSWGAGPGNDQVWWRLPATFPTEFMSGVNLNFQGVGQGARIAPHDDVPRLVLAGLHPDADLGGQMDCRQPVSELGIGTKDQAGLIDRRPCGDRTVAGRARNENV